MDVELIVRTTAVLLGAGAIVALLRRAAPSTRHLVWHIAIVAVLLTPILVPLAPAAMATLWPSSRKGRWYSISASTRRRATTPRI